MYAIIKKSNVSDKLHVQIPEGFIKITGVELDCGWGVLVKNINTGIYRILLTGGNTMRSIDQAEARKWDDAQAEA